MTRKPRFENPFSGWPPTAPFRHGIGVTVKLPQSQAGVIFLIGGGIVLIGLGGLLLLMLLLQGLGVCCPGAGDKHGPWLACGVGVFGAILIFAGRAEARGTRDEAIDIGHIDGYFMVRKRTPKGIPSVRNYDLRVVDRVEAVKAPKKTLTWDIVLWCRNQRQILCEIYDEQKAYLLQERLHEILDFMKQLPTEEEWQERKRDWWPSSP